MIEITKLSKSYNTKALALNNIDVKIKEGDLVAVLGNNGAGKSTLFKIIAGIISEYEGSCVVLGEKSHINLSDRISYIPEVRGLDTKGYVLEHLIDLMQYKGYCRKEAKNRILKWMEDLDMIKYKYSRVGELSKGNQQKLQIILAVSNNPKILILDEPFSGLDVIAIDAIWFILEKLNKDGCTILFTTHEIDNKLLRCNYFLFIKDGELIISGTMDELAAQYKMVLEIENQSLKVLNIENNISGNYYKENDNCYYIEVDNPEMAHKIFDSLENKYSEKFWLRNKNLSEIYFDIYG